MKTSLDRLAAYHAANAKWPLPLSGAMTADDFRAALKQLNLSQRKLAQLLGVETSTVNRWAKGNLPVPQYAAFCLALLAQLPLTAR